MTAPRTVRVRVEGRVQGVGFRAWTAQQATRYALLGWVKNLPDGAVETEIQAPEADEANLLEKMVADLQRGPRLAKVSRLESIEVKNSPRYHAFEILR